jgi:glycerophosphoryl diester phosphodiesterase
MTKIVGHRGAKGLELENTVKGFKLTKELGVDSIELDVLSTRDGILVVCHDDDLKRLSGKQVKVSELTYSELAEIHLTNNETIPLLYDVLALLKGLHVIIDVKTDKHLDELFMIINKYPDLDITIVTWLKHIIKECKRQRPDIPVFVERYFSPGLLMRSIRKHGADGLNLRYIWLNPFIYRSVKKQGMQIQVYTVDNVLVARLLKKLYPGIWICTNYPDMLKAAFETSTPPQRGIFHRK